MTRAVFLDRDGVLIKSEVRDGKPYALHDSFDIYDCVADAIAQIHNSGFLTILVTNQPDIGNGLVSADVVNGINGQLQRKLNLTDTFVCPHTNEDGCDCRKPGPGMLLAAARKHNIDLPRSFMVGDRWRDIGAGQAAGCATVWVDRGYTEQQPENPDVTVSELIEAVPFILGEPR